MGVEEERERQRQIAIAKAKFKFKQQQQRATVQAQEQAPVEQPAEEPSFTNKALDVGLRGLNVLGGTFRTGVGRLADVGQLAASAGEGALKAGGDLVGADTGDLRTFDQAFGDKNLAARENDLVDSLAGTGAGFGELAERVGVPAGPEFDLLPEDTNIPFTDINIGKGGVNARDIAGFIGDAGSDPINVLLGGAPGGIRAALQPTRAILKKGGDKVFRSGIERVDNIILANARKKGLPEPERFSKLATREKFKAGDAESFAKQNEAFIKKTGEKRDAAFKEAEKKGVVIDNDKALAPARKEIAKLKSSDDLDDLKSIKSLEDKVERLAGPPNKRISEGSIPVGATKGKAGTPDVPASQIPLPAVKGKAGTPSLPASSVKLPATAGKAGAPGLPGSSVKLPATKGKPPGKISSAGSIPVGKVPARTQVNALTGEVVEIAPALPATKIPTKKVTGSTTPDFHGLNRPAPGTPGLPAASVPLPPIAAKPGAPGLPATSIKLPAVKGKPASPDIAASSINLPAIKGKPSTQGLPATSIPVSTNPGQRLNLKTMQFEKVTTKRGLESASDIKTKFANKLSDNDFSGPTGSAFRKLKSNPKKIAKKVEEGFRKEVIRAGNEASPGLGTKIDKLNKDFAASLGARKALTKESVKEIPETLRQKLTGTGARTRVGRSIENIASPVDAVVRQGVNRTLNKETGRDLGRFQKLGR